MAAFSSPLTHNLILKPLDAVMHRAVVVAHAARRIPKRQERRSNALERSVGEICLSLQYHHLSRESSAVRRVCARVYVREKHAPPPACVSAPGPRAPALYRSTGGRTANHEESPVSDATGPRLPKHYSSPDGTKIASALMFSHAQALSPQGARIRQSVARVPGSSRSNRPHWPASSDISTSDARFSCSRAADRPGWLSPAVDHGGQYVDQTLLRYCKDYPKFPELENPPPVLRPATHWIMTGAFPQ